MPFAAPPFPRLLLSLCLAAATAHASGDSLPLKNAPALGSAAPKGKSVEGPTYIEADQLHGINTDYFEGEGKVIMRNLREQVEADWIHYEQPNDEVQAHGGVVFTQGSNHLRGSELKLKLASRLGYFKEIAYDLRSNRGELTRGIARVVNFKGPERYQMEQATYSSCPAEQQDWVLKADELDLDYNSSLGSARGVWVEYLNTPILYTPWLDFALDSKRKSGFLAPSYGASSERGLELLTPWYWNLAPNYDATLTPRLMTRRGLQLGGEFRYLEADFNGTFNLEALPGDRESNSNRYLVRIDHQQQLGPHWSGRVQYEKVSDNTYFTDLSSLVTQTSQVNLPEQASLAYDGGWWQAAGRVQAYQTLQDPVNAVVAPYERLPQLTLNANQANLTRAGLNLDFSGEFVNFNYASGQRVQGSRLYAYPGISLPINTPYSTVTPRLGWSLSRYALDDSTRQLQDSLAAAPSGGFRDTTRSLPTFSLDSSLFFERDMAFHGETYTQTLEPRAYYVYIPYRNQSSIPVFDSGASDLSLDQLFRENQFNGIDRINNANQLTLAVSSRFLQEGTGAERLQLTLGQRYYFGDQQVTLPGVATRGNNSSDLIGQVTGQVNPKLRLSSTVQFDADSGKLNMADLGGTWRNGPGQLFNANYRYTLGSVNQFDLSTQWPLTAKWHGLARINYSLQDTRMVEGLAGFEYNAGCWSVRGVAQRLATNSTTVSNAFFLQLELNGLAYLGPNPLDVLKRSITGYVPSNPIALPASAN